MNKTTLKVLSTVAMFLGTATAALANDCPPADVSVEFKTNEARIVDEYSSADIKAFDKQVFAASKDFALFGYVKDFGKVKKEFEFDEDLASQNKGYTCVKKVSLSFEYKPVILVSSQTKKSSCVYNETIVHEKEHVAIENNSLKSAMPNVKSQLEKSIKIDISSTATDYKAEYKKFIDKLVLQTLDGAMAQHQELEKRDGKEIENLRNGIKSSTGMGSCDLNEYNSVYKSLK